MREDKDRNTLNPQAQVTVWKSQKLVARKLFRDSLISGSIIYGGSGESFMPACHTLHLPTSKVTFAAKIE